MAETPTRAAAVKPDRGSSCGMSRRFDGGRRRLEHHRVATDAVIMHHGSYHHRTLCWRDAEGYVLRVHVQE